MRTLTTLLVALLAACLAMHAATFTSSSTGPTASPVFTVLSADDAQVVRVRVQHTQGPWDIPAPPVPIERAVAAGETALLFTEIPFGINTIELLGSDGAVRAKHYVEKWVTPMGDQYLRADLTNCVFASSARADAPDLPQLVGAGANVTVYKGDEPSISIVTPTSAVPAGTVCFTCSHDGTCAVWLGDERIAARRPYRAGDVMSITLNLALARADRLLTVRLENGYRTAVQPVAPGQVPGWPAVTSPGATAGAGAGTTGAGAGAAGVTAAGALGSFVVTRCDVHTLTEPQGGSVRIEFAACASLVTPPVGNEPGSIAAAGIVSSGVWVRIVNPGVTEPKDVYVYRADDGAAVSGIARWRLEGATAVFEGALDISARGIPAEFIGTLTQGTTPLAIAVGWGDDRMEWQPALIWTQEADGSWTGTLPK